MTDLEKAKISLHLQKNKAFQRILKEASFLGRKRLVLTTYECLKYNHVSHDGSTSDLPRHDGKFDIEGYSCPDVNVRIVLKPWSVSDIKSYLRSLVLMWKECRGLPLWSQLRLLWSALNPVSDPWIFVIDSLDTIKVTVLESLTVKSYLMHSKKQIAAVKAGDPEGIASSLGYIKVAQGLWVSNTDPTCMIVDESLTPFEMKDGWSPRQISEIVDRWFSVMGYNIKTTFRK